MPETGLNRRRLQDHLRRCWVIYLAGIVLLFFLNNLVYTVTRPAFTEEETMKIMLVNAECTLSDEAYAAMTMDLLPRLQEQAPQIQVLEIEQLAGVTKENPQSAMLLKTKLVSGFGDIYLTDSIAFSMLAEQVSLFNLRDISLDGWEAVPCSEPETNRSFTGGICISSAAFVPAGGDGKLYLSVPANTTDPESALAALPLIASAIME